MYFRYDDVLYLSDGVILYKDRVIVPVNLQFRVFNKLHSAIKEWINKKLCPTDCLLAGYYQNIEAIQAKCQVCNCNSSSQPSMPQEVSNTPYKPFMKDIFWTFPFCQEQPTRKVTCCQAGWTPNKMFNPQRNLSDWFA